MRKKQIGVFASAFLILFGLTLIPQGAGAGNVEKELVIDPGAAGRCTSDFAVENQGSDVADLKVVLGDKVYISVLVNPAERLAYSLPGTIALAKFHGLEDLKPDEEAVIINLGPTSKLKIWCYKLRENPLPDEDPLRKFK